MKKCWLAQKGKWYNFWCPPFTCLSSNEIYMTICICCEREKRESFFFCTLLWDPISRRLCIISKKFRALVYNKRYFDHGNLSDYGNDTDDNNIVILVISIHASPLGTFCGQFTLWQEVNQHSFCNHEPAQGLLWYFPFVSLLECCLFILGCVQVWVLFHRGSVLQWQTWSTFKGLQQVSTFSLACHVFKWIHDNHHSN